MLNLYHFLSSDDWNLLPHKIDNGSCSHRLGEQNDSWIEELDF